MKLNALMVRYIVNDVDTAVAFYSRHLGFQATAQSGADFALLARENMQLVLSPPKGPGGGSQPMPDGRRPEPGGWNRIIVRSSNLEDDIARRMPDSAEGWRLGGKTSPETTWMTSATRANAGSDQATTRTLSPGDCAVIMTVPPWRRRAH